MLHPYSIGFCQHCFEKCMGAMIWYPGTLLSKTIEKIILKLPFLDWWKKSEEENKLTLWVVVYEMQPLVSYLFIIQSAHHLIVLYKLN